MKTHIRWRKVLKTMGYKKEVNRRNTIVFYIKRDREGGHPCLRETTIAWKWKHAKANKWHTTNNKSMAKMIRKKLSCHNEVN